MPPTNATPLRDAVAAAAAVQTSTKSSPRVCATPQTQFDCEVQEISSITNGTCFALGDFIDGISFRADPSDSDNDLTGVVGIPPWGSTPWIGVSNGAENGVLEFNPPTLAAGFEVGNYFRDFLFPSSPAPGIAFDLYSPDGSLIDKVVYPNPPKLSEGSVYLAFPRLPSKSVPSIL